MPVYGLRGSRWQLELLLYKILSLIGVIQVGFRLGSPNVMTMKCFYIFLALTCIVWSSPINKIRLKQRTLLGLHRARSWSINFDLGCLNWWLRGLPQRTKRSKHILIGCTQRRFVWNLSIGVRKWAI